VAAKIRIARMPADVVVVYLRCLALVTLHEKLQG